MASERSTLSLQELRDLTGYTQVAKITAWLTERGWVFEPAARRGSCPAVDRTYYLARMSGQARGSERKSKLRLDRM
jgi:hypothetical protein